MEETQQTGTEAAPLESSTRGLMRSPMVQQAVREDPLLSFIFRHRNVILIAVLVIMGGAYARNVFRDSHEASMAQAADKYQRMRELYSGFVSESEQLERTRISMAGKELSTDDKKKIDALQRSLDQKKVGLNEILISLSDEKTPYKDISQIYRDLILVVDGEITKVEAGVSNINWREAGSPDSTQRFFAELRALAGARGLIDSEASFERARKILKELASEGNFVHVSAALTLSKLAQSEAEKAEALEILRKVSETHSEQSELIAPELLRLEGGGK